MTGKKDISEAMAAHMEAFLIEEIPCRDENDPTALSNWFPKIRDAGLPVPETRLLTMTDEAHLFLQSVVFGEPVPEHHRGAYSRFLQELGEAASEVGFPCFLRTDYTSNKHDWKDACFVKTADDLDRQVSQIAFFSALADFAGLPFRNWAVRELLPTIPYGICPNFGDMPICKEFRFFVTDGKVDCFHPYWPLHALEQGGTPSNLDFEELCRLECEKNHGSDSDVLHTLAEMAGEAVGGSWSVDILETSRGWCVTDMAEAHKSYHWEGCPNGSHSV